MKASFLFLCFDFRFTVSYYQTSKGIRVTSLTRNQTSRLNLLFITQHTVLYLVT